MQKDRDGPQHGVLPRLRIFPHTAARMPYAPSQYGPGPYERPAYPRKSLSIAFVLSFLVPGVGQLYLGKVPRGIVYIVTLVALSVVSFFLTMNVDVNDVASINRVVTDPLFIGLTLASLGVWAFSLYDTYRLVQKYNDASMRNDLPRFLKEF